MSGKRLFLKIKRIIQTKPTSCMAAALASIYNFYGKDRSEIQIWEQRKKLRPGGKQEFIFTDDIILDARENGFEASWDRVDLNNKNRIKNLLEAFKNQGIPIIVVNQFAKDKRTKGHARIVTDVSNTSIYLHDPDPDIGGAHRRFSWEEFIESWQPTGPEVTGGVYIVIKSKKN